jgi:hypothetical protein
MINANTKRFIALNIVGSILALILNFLAVSLPINNKTTGELSDAYPNYFVPAGFTFSIWGIIYLLMLGFVVYQGYSYLKKSELSLKLIEKIGVLFFANCIANALWIIAWHYEQVGLSLFIMLFLLFSLIKIYNIISEQRPLALTDNIFIHLFFSIYLGWISVATIANVTTLIVSSGWSANASVQASWSSAMVIVAMVLGIVMIFSKQDIAYAGVIIWAIYGIYSKRISFVDDAASMQVATVSKYCMAMLAIYALLNLVGKRFYLFESK